MDISIIGSVSVPSALRNSPTVISPSDMASEKTTPMKNGTEAGDSQSMV